VKSGVVHRFRMAYTFNKIKLSNLLPGCISVNPLQCYNLNNILQLEFNHTVVANRRTHVGGKYFHIQSNGQVF